MSRRRWVLTAAVIATAALFAAVFAWREPRDPLARLARASRSLDTRVTEARLSGFPYAPRPVKSHRFEAPRLRLRAVAGRILQATAHDDHAAGVAVLIAGATDDAVKRLTACAELHPNDATVWNDLAAARYESATAEDDPQQLVSALAAADHALRIKPLGEAAFNRGLILESLGLYAAAINAYDHFIRTERASEWTTEARERTDKLRLSTAAEEWQKALPQLKRAAAAGDGKTVRDIVGRFTQEAESWSETFFLGEWSDAIIRGERVTAADRLRLVAAVGDALAAINGDTLIRDAVASIKASNTDRARESIIAQAQLSYVRARKLYKERNVAEAQSMFVAASRSFARAGSPMAAVAEYRVCSTLYDHKQNDAAQATIDRLLAALPVTHKTLRAHLLWDRGLILGQTGRLYEALGAQREAREIFAALGERMNAIDMNGQIAAEEAILGHRNEAWHARRDIFRDASAAGDNTELQKAIEGAARTEAVAGHWDNAYALLGLAAEPSMRVNPRLWANTLFWRALTAGNLRLNASAHADVAGARKAGEAIPDKLMRARATADATFAEAVVLLDTNPGQSANLLDAYIDRVGAEVLFLPEALLERARVRKALGDVRHAVDDLSRATKILRSRQDQRPRDEWRDAFFHTSDAVARELSGILETSDTAESAFKAIDESRAEAYGSTENALTVSGATAIVEYVVHPDHLSAFVKTSRGMQVSRVSVTARDAEHRCQAFSSDPNDRVAAARCAALLLKPIEAELAPLSDFVIVPDTAFARVPFAALPFAASGRYLVEHASITIAPSATTALDRRRAEAVRGHGDGIVAIGNPDFDRKRFPRLGSLPGAEREAIAIGKMYPQATVLLGSHATRANVLAAMKNAASLHLGTHAIATSDPRRSHLVLAPDAGDAGILFLSDIEQASVAIRLAVLAGCHTASSDGEQSTVGNLALAFIAAGAANAVGSLQDIDDDWARLFLDQFYQELRAGATPADALRAVQLEMVHSSNPQLREPRAWSAIQLYGIVKNLEAR